MKTKTFSQWAPVWIAIAVFSFGVAAAVPRALNTTTFSTLFTGEAGSGADAFNASTNGARWHFGTGANDYASSDGTTVTFASPLSSTSHLMGGVLAFSSTAPTLTGFGGTGAGVSGTATSFDINVGTVAPGGTGTVTLPTASNGWICNCTDITTPDTNVTAQNGGSATSCTLKNYVRTTGIAGNWTASDHLRCTATAY